MLMFLLLMIPIVNLLCLIVWACGGSNKKNKVNLSRAMLFCDSINELMELGNELKNIQPQ